MTAPSETATVQGMGRLPSLAVIGVIGGAALIIGPRLPLLNAVVVALVLGAVLANVAGRLGTLNEAVSRFMLKDALKFAVVLLGAGINLSILRTVGVPALTAAGLSVIVAMGVSLLVGTRLGLRRSAAALIGVGTAICGASAIAAVAPVLRSRREEIAVALATVFTFNAVALVVYPLLGAGLGMSEVAFGTWAGLGVHDTATSVAAGFAFGDVSGEVATLVKLTRTLYLVPTVLVVAVVVSRADGSRDQGLRQAMKSFPWFVVWFAVLAGANTLGLLGPVGDIANDAAKVLLVFVVAAVGASLRVKDIAGVGWRLFVTGVIASAAVGLIGFVAINVAQL